MFQTETYIQRRKNLLKEIKDGIILIYGNTLLPINYAGNTHRFRQDSNFLYFFGISQPNLIGMIDANSGESILFGNDLSVDDSIWVGTQPTISDFSLMAGVDKFKTLAELDTLLHTAQDQKRNIHYLPPYQHERKIKLSALLSASIEEVNTNYSHKLIDAVVKLRSIKDDLEVEQIEDALNSATRPFHIQAMKMAKPGINENEIAAMIEGIARKQNCSMAYNPICSVHGEILHNLTSLNTLTEGQFLLIDAGAENSMHYASDITRTTPVGGRFNSKQKNIYEIVLEAQILAIEAIRPGIRYLDIHLQTARIIAEGLKSLGLLKGSVDDLVHEGAHALFFPHGLGHMIGLDVHDMEDLGEDHVGYDKETVRSNQFGTAYLRLAKKLQPGFVITVEPGIYFIPALVDKWRSENKLADFINYDLIVEYLELGGVRIEDNVLVTNNSCRVLGKPIPKSIVDFEELFN